MQWGPSCSAIMHNYLSLRSDKRQSCVKNCSPSSFEWGRWWDSCKKKQWIYLVMWSLCFCCFLFGNDFRHVNSPELLKSCAASELQICYSNFLNHIALWREAPCPHRYSPLQFFKITERPLTSAFSFPLHSFIPSFHTSATALHHSVCIFVRFALPLPPLFTNL